MWAATDTSVTKFSPMTMENDTKVDQLLAGIIRNQLHPPNMNMMYVPAHLHVSEIR